jgi:hypothetical protein
MRIIDRTLVEAIPRTDASTYDQQLSRLSIDGQPFIVVNPELPYDVLDLIKTNIVDTTACIKYKVGEGWIAKQFPAQWNGSTRIVQIIPNAVITANAYVDSVPEHKPDAWDLKYRHVWTYKDTTIEAVTIDYLPVTEGTKTIGSVKFIEDRNQFDVIFISYNEPTAEANWQRLLTKCPTAKRINGIKGILNAHKAAAELSTTSMVWIVDADAYIADEFEFKSFIYDRNITYIWHSLNPVNGLEYGYGGVKLFPKKLLIDTKTDLIDISTSLGGVCIINQVACETRFNIDPFNTWKSAFRECVKLSSKLIRNQNNKDTDTRLTIWQTVGKEKEFGIYSIEGAVLGAEYGSKHKDDRDALKKINNYAWLKELFNGHYTNNT